MKTIVSILTLAFTLSASASLMITHEASMTSNNDNGTRDMGTGISAEIGDVLVFSTALNASATYSYNATSGDGGAVDSLTSLQLGTVASVSYYTVTAAGTFDLSIDTVDARFAVLAAYVISSDAAGGSVELLAQDTTFVGVGVSTTNTLDYGSFDQSSGIVIEAVSSGAGYTNNPAPVDHTAVRWNNVNTRGALKGTFTDVTSLTVDYVADGTGNNSRTTGMAFTEAIVIPEPSTLALFGIFLAVMIGRMRKIA